MLGRSRGRGRLLGRRVPVPVVAGDDAAAHLDAIDAALARGERRPQARGKVRYQRCARKHINRGVAALESATKLVSEVDITGRAVPKFIMNVYVYVYTYIESTIVPSPMRRIRDRIFICYILYTLMAQGILA